MNGFARRIATVSIWPLIDVTVTVVANVMLVHLGVRDAIIGAALLGAALNLIFFYILSFENEIHDLFLAEMKKRDFTRLQKLSMEFGRTFAVLAAYTVSGPAMVGAPLVWLLGIRGRKAYLLIAAGAMLNAIVWVGGIYNLFWLLVRTVIIRF